MIDSPKNTYDQCHKEWQDIAERECKSFSEVKDQIMDIFEKLSTATRSLNHFTQMFNSSCDYRKGCKFKFLEIKAWAFEKFPNEKRILEASLGLMATLSAELNFIAQENDKNAWSTRAEQLHSRLTSSIPYVKTPIPQESEQKGFVKGTLGH